MSKIAIITDVNAGLDYLEKQYDIHVLRSIINFGTEHYVDGIGIKADEFYQRIAKITDSSKIPSTSAPTIGEAMELLERLIDEGYTDAIMYSISNKMSSIYEMMCTLKEEYEGKINLHVVDTLTSVYAQAYMAIKAREMADEGKSVEEIIDYSNFLIKNNHLYFVVDNLNYLIKNGRLSATAGTIAALLKIKPILEINSEGSIVACEKVRTHSRAVETAYNKVVEVAKQAKKVQIVVFHTNRENDADLLLERVKKEDPKFSNALIATVTPAVGAHIGYGILGIGYIIEEK